MNTIKVLELIRKGDFDRDFIDIYVDAEQLEYQKERYTKAITKFIEWYGDEEINIFSYSEVSDFMYYNIIATYNSTDGKSVFGISSL